MSVGTQECFLKIRIDRHAVVCPGDQVAARIRRAVETGELRAGDALPSVRRLAADLGISPNTAASAYDLLRGLGVIQARRQVGFSVADGPAAPVKQPAGAAAADLPPVSSRSEIARNAAFQLSGKSTQARAFKINVPLFSSASEKTWSRLAQKVGQYPERHAFYSSPQGYLPLRRLIARS